jgi:predicted cupin superfamily sugar epimerase
VIGPRFWIGELGLEPHPEGGWFREVYRAKESVPASGLPARYGGPRAFSTSIYFLLASGQVSRLHRLASDEVWHFYAGGPLRFHVFGEDGTYRSFLMGRDPRRRQALQAVLPGGATFGVEVAGRRSYALCACTVAPGFEYADFAFARREDLAARFPGRRALIARLARA